MLLKLAATVTGKMLKDQESLKEVFHDGWTQFLCLDLRYSLLNKELVRIF